MDNHCKENQEHTLKIVNIGIPRFFEAIVAQNVKGVQIDWRPPVKQTKEIQDMLDMFM